MIIIIITLLLYLQDAGIAQRKNTRQPFQRHMFDP